MRIECLTTFLDGRERYEQGDIFTMRDEEKAAYFVKNGWAKEANTLSQTPASDTAGTADLTIHNSAIGVGDSNG